MKELLEFIIRGITGSDSSIIEETEEEDRLNLNVKANKDLMGLIIGKGGRTIKAVRNLLRVKATLAKKGVFVNVSEKE